MKFYGRIGYDITSETVPGVWSSDPTEKEIVGEFTKAAHRFVDSGGVNDNIKMVSTISIIADPFAMENYNLIKYVKTPEGIAWKVDSVDISQYPRIILTLGEVFNNA